MDQAAERREREVVAATQAAIDKHRKTEAVIRILDASGRPVPGGKVSVEQTAHDFFFGGNIYMFDRFRDEARRTTPIRTRSSRGAGITGFA